MLHKGCLLVGLFSVAAVVLTGCTPAVQSDGATTDVRVWSNMTAPSGVDVVEVEVLPNIRRPRRTRAPANVTAPVPQRRAAPPVESPRQKVSRLERNLERLQKELARVQQELARLRRQPQ